MPKRPPRLTKLVPPTLIIVGGFTLFTILGSRWYWECNAEISIETLLPKPCPERAEEQVLPRKECEDQLFPEFGACNESYDDIGVFWKNDIAENVAGAVTTSLAAVSTPFMRDQIVPAWNSVFSLKEARESVAAGIGGITLLIAGFVAKGWWDKYMHENEDK